MVALAVAVSAWVSFLAVLGVLAVLIAVTAATLSERDTAAVAISFIAVVALFPATLQVPALGSIGTPQIMLGVIVFNVWAVTWLAPTLRPRRLRPVPVLIAGFMTAMLLSYLSACLRPTDALERSAADRGVVLLVAAVGAALLISESVANLGRLDAVLKAVVLAGAFIAAVGIVQFAIGYDLASVIRLPGFQSVSAAGGFISERSIFRRVAGTTVHAIEFSAVLCMTLPVALHLAMRVSRRWYVPAAMIAVALPMSVSRTAVLGLGALGIVLITGWERRTRRMAYVGLVGYLVVMRVAVPGLLGTIRALFADAGADPSIASRQQDYDFVTNFIHQRPVFGRGYATFVPTRYDFLDNQYLLSTVETGYVGVACYIVLIVGGMVTAQAVRRRTTDPRRRDLAHALTASLAVVLFTSAAFDFLSFPTARAMLFILLGCVGCLWRLSPREADDLGPPDDDVVPSAALVEARRRAAARMSLIVTGAKPTRPHVPASTSVGPQRGGPGAF